MRDIGLRGRPVFQSDLTQMDSVDQRTVKVQVPSFVAPHLCEILYSPGWSTIWADPLNRYSPRSVASPLTNASEEILGAPSPAQLPRMPIVSPACADVGISKRYCSLSAHTGAVGAITIINKRV
jgi:hypothetical protein